MSGKVFLIPTTLHDDGNAFESIPPYVLTAVKQSQSFFVENERTARRFLKRLWKEMVIDDYYWHSIQKVEKNAIEAFVKRLQSGENIAILSEAGCPGIADPGQILIAEAQKINAKVIPFVGPSSILLSLMASGMNGQHFEFMGYLPIENNIRKKIIKDMERNSLKENKTYIFIETPYRNNTLIKDIIDICNSETKLCIAVEITSSNENIKTQTVKNWRKNLPDIHKHPAIFLLYAGNL